MFYNKSCVEETPEWLKVAVPRSGATFPLSSRGQGNATQVNFGLQGM